MPISFRTVWIATMLSELSGSKLIFKDLSHWASPPPLQIFRYSTKCFSEIEIAVSREFTDFVYKTLKLTIIDKEKHSFFLRFYYLNVKAASSHVFLTWPHEILQASTKERGKLYDARSKSEL